VLLDVDSTDSETGVYILYNINTEEAC